jgi:acyl carrier protein
VSRIEQILTGIRPEFNFSESEDFIADGMLDSYDVLMLVADLDKSYGISIAGVDILPENLRNITSIEKLLAKYITQS